MADLGKAFVQIIPSAEGIAGKIKKELDGVEEHGSKSGQGWGKKFADAAKKIIAVIGIGKMIGDALNEGGNLQQSYLGGLDTLYGDAADAARQYAREAAAAGISMNEYSEQAVSFGAALKNAYGGDVKKAAESANTAIMDMADNSAKMGTDIQSVQAAYQGFAKQNYTMLDNLKLGYGGTKTEMERLLARANEINAANGKITNYSIDNLGDVYDAIHVIQDELNISGSAAKEAGETLSGSFAAVKASWKNLLGDLALGNDITASLQVLANSVSTWLISNLIPMVGNVLSSLPTLIVGIVQSISAYAGNLLQVGVDMITNVWNGIVQAVPLLITACQEMVTTIINIISTVDWASIGTNLIDFFDNGIMTQIPEVYASFLEMLDGAIAFIEENLPAFLDEGIQIITNMVNGIFENIPNIIGAIGEVVSKLLDYLMRNLPMFMQKGWDLISSIASGIMKNLPGILGSIGQVIGRVLASIVSNLPQFLAKGVEIIVKLAAGIVKAIPQVLKSIAQLIKQAVSGFTKTDWKSVGRNLINGIVQGIKNVGSRIKDTLMGFAQSAWKSVKSFFGISSPSKLMRDTIGRYIPEGMAVGIEKNADYVYDAMESLANKAMEFPLDQTLSLATTAEIEPASAGSSTTNYGGVNININAADYANPIELAEAVAKILNSQIKMKGAVFA